MSRHALTAIALTLVAAACHQAKRPEPQPREASPTPSAVAVTPPPSPSASPGASPSAPAVKLDTGALSERKDPDRLLRFYAAALHARDWAAAARAWGAGSGVTAATLEGSYDRVDPPTLDIGKGAQEGAAGSIYYEAPVTLRFGPGAPAETGSLVLRRVNDVDGATPEQLRWRIERSTIGQGQ